MGADKDGSVTEELGLYGLPETFVIDRSGRIAYVHATLYCPGQLLEGRAFPTYGSLKKSHCWIHNQISTQNIAPCPNTP
jgi:cytochrome c biogenesis protein CcmG/thiol:disulfide interchange protein DsbE